MEMIIKSVSIASQVYNTENTTNWEKPLKKRKAT